MAQWFSISKTFIKMCLSAMKSGRKKDAKYTDIKIKTSYKGKNKEIVYFLSYWSIWKLLDWHASPITMLGKSAKDLAENIWNTVSQRVRRPASKQKHREITGHKEISAKPPYRKNTAYTPVQEHCLESCWPRFCISRRQTSCLVHPCSPYLLSLNL